MGARVLIAEDDGILALRIRKTVEAMGYQAVGLVATGEDAVRVAEEQRPDVVLMDIRLRGEMTGVEAARRIHASSGAPVIYLTAYSDEQLIAQAARTAPYAYLTKPIRDRELHASIEMVLYKSASDWALCRLNRVLRSVRDVNQLITRERDADRLLDQACQTLLRTSGYVAILIVQPDAASSRLSVLAHAGATEALLEWLRTANPGTLAAAPSGTALDAAQPQVMQLAAPGPGSGGSVAIVPMRHAERVYGGLCVHATRPEAFDADEVDLLLELAGDLAFALRALDEAALRERAEQALAASHENWRRLVEHQPTGNVVHRDGIVLYANEAALRIAGVGRLEHLIGRHVLTLVHPGSREAFESFVSPAETPAAPGSVEIQLLRPTGESIDVEVTSLPVTYLDQAAIQSVFWDVRERRRAEEQLRRAQKLDSAGRLAAGVAHDFNNMLQGILAHTQLLKIKLHPPDARIEHVNEIMTAALRCGDLSRRLLAFSRRQLLDLRVVDLREVVRRMETLLRGTLHEDIRLQVRVSDEPCRVKADMGQLEHVLMNLAVNGQDAMPRGGTLSVEVAPRARAVAARDAPGAWVELSVSDTGSGMDSFVREHAFEPFFTSKEPGRGTGLGLAMVHGIVQQHGGSVEFESEVGVGTTFHIRLPACLETVAELPGAPVAMDPGGRERVLIVEDTESVLRVTASVLERLGYSVSCAENGRAALALLDRPGSAPDLLLTDVVMPEMNGRELAALVRERHPAVKVLFMSGHDPAVVASHGVLEDGAALISKPISVHELAAKVRRVLDGS